ncbi:MAG TPA: NAD(P)-binding domain-containing protein, partial [Burkholderiales bacterium]|nr:NAD(P)-binding domain-containing protein [Burkholderiales bacterium]
MPAAAKEFGIVGLGRIGAGIAHHAIEKGMRVVGTSRSGAPRDLVAAGLTEITGLSGFRAQLRPPRAILLYIPAGPAVDTTLD